MVLHGRIENGAVVLPTDVSLPEGTEVTIIVQPNRESAKTQSNEQHRVQLPLVESNQPATRRLTAERIAEILEEDDLSSRR